MKTLNLKEPDFRMRDVEILVRYFAFRNFGNTYNGNLKQFLDSTCKTLNKTWESQENKLRLQAQLLEGAIDLAFKVFDGRPFRKWDGVAYETRFNRAIFDIVPYFFCFPMIADAVSSKDYKAIESAFKDLCENDSNFVRSVETTTKSKATTALRFATWAKELRQLLKINVESPIAE